MSEGDYLYEYLRASFQIDIWSKMCAVYKLLRYV